MPRSLRFSLHAIVLLLSCKLVSLNADHECNSAKTETLSKLNANLSS